MYIVYKNMQGEVEFLDTIEETMESWGSDTQDSYTVDPKDNKLYYSCCYLTSNPLKEEMAEEMSKESKTLLGDVMGSFGTLRQLVTWSNEHAAELQLAHQPTQQEREDFFNDNRD